jgi:hypothetical protein
MGRRVSTVGIFRTSPVMSQRGLCIQGTRKCLRLYVPKIRMAGQSPPLSAGHLAAGAFRGDTC